MKNHIIRKTPLRALWLFAVAFLFLTVGANAGNAPDSTWTLQSSKDNVDCYYKIVNCNDETTVFLVFDNKNSGQVKVSWTDLFTTQFDTDIEGMEGLKELVLSTGSSDIYGCSDGDNVVINHAFEVHPAYFAKINGYKFGSLTVTTIN